MSDDRTPTDRLDALLSGLEDEVLRSNQTGQRLADEGGATENVGVIRSSIESLIRAQQMGDHKRLQEPMSGDNDDAKEAKAKVVLAMERLGRWAGVVQGGRPTGATPRVRMAFSGERSEKVGKIARNATRCQQSGSDDTENEG